MKFCAKCGACYNDESVKYCGICGFEFKKHKFNIQKKNVIIFFLSIIMTSIMLFGFIIFSNFSSEPTLKQCEDLLGVSIEDIVSNDEFIITNSLGFKIAKSTTPDVFNINGEIVIFILEEEEGNIDIVTWQSKDGVKLTESEIEFFVEKIIKIYGKPITESENYYMWHNEKISLSLKTEDEEIYLMFVNNN